MDTPFSVGSRSFTVSVESVKDPSALHRSAFTKNRFAGKRKSVVKCQFGSGLDIPLSEKREKHAFRTARYLHKSIDRNEQVGE